MLSPIIMFVYNRPDHTKQTIEALAENYLAKDSILYIFSDNAKNKNAQNAVNLTREYIDTIPDRNIFSDVKIIKASKNKGLGKSVIDGVTEIINIYGKVIVLEDDLVTSKDYLQFMNESLDFYQDNLDIWSISGYNLPISIPEDYEEDVYVAYRANSWGWATWENRWKLVDWDVSDYSLFSQNYKLRKSFNQGGRDLSYMLDNQMSGRIDSWAIRWCYSQWKNSMMTIYPTKSKVKNIGLDGSGTHSGNTQKYQTKISETPGNTKLSTPKINKKILSEFKNYYMSTARYLLLSIKYRLLRML